MKIRRREDRDLSACAAVLKEVHAKDGYPVEGVDDALGWLTPDGLVGAWVAESDGEVVGHLCVTGEGGEDAARLWQARGGWPVGVLARLFVHPDARGRSLGERLTVAAMKDARERGTRLVLDVMEKDRAAIRLYEKLGWERLGEISHVIADRRVPAFAYVSPS
ncbi:GNAT family N-acetyltransferase [Nocardiopsis sp. MG754419]|uniref:GNAT family N-acetyltransferase n=1 Tax=Nocardiopsis sp. MG754419 TaxID=2259865 RepID=UPI001BACA9C5|nr:GNAT family N-acetyltransferase [Nocardiopsis sp. MG754419]MBR8745147.1 GNAT family N-acetyltransferase [Nocardiopsis sp. MG754419]